MFQKVLAGIIILYLFTTPLLVMRSLAADTQIDTEITGNGDGSTNTVTINEGTPTPTQTQVQTPSFISCENPSRSPLISYDSGTHGIVGDGATHTGSDSVYQVSDTTYTQCFCPDNGTSDGIQTNWWHVSDLSQDEINSLTSSGWLYVANGADWGLPEGSYLAKNSSFTCPNHTSEEGSVSCTPTPTPTETVSETPTPTPTATPTPTENNTSGSSANSSSNSSSSSSNSSTPEHNSAQATMLAATGNIALIYLLIIMGAASMISGMLIRRFAR